MIDKLYAFWKFSRPHTIFGTSLSVLGLYLLALGAFWRLQALLGLGLLPSLFWALAACLAANVFIVGLNQLEDIAIDRVNKPYLPLASGELSKTEGRVVVVALGAAAVSIALVQWAQSPFLLLTILLSLLIGTAYSLPPFRLKRFPLPASLCIFTVRGLVVNLGLFAHFDQVLNGVPSQVALNLPPSLWALSAFVLVMTFVIAVFKDVPDMEGDRKYQIATFTILWGAPFILRLSRGLLAAAYGMVALLGAWLPGVNSQTLVVSHLLLLAVVLFESLRVDLQHKQSVCDFYQFIWRLFYLEYLVFPLAVLVQS